jgi:phage gpG-like protein
MKPNEFINKLKKLKSEIDNFVITDAPIIVGKNAVDYFKENFIKGSFDGKAWKAPQRYNENGNASQKYGPLLSATDELMKSITFTTQPGKAIISTDKVYARIHNEGGVINIPVTEKMRKFAWAKHYETKQKDSKWKWMALTQKESLKINMPQRQFIGITTELTDILEKKLSEHLTKIIK